MENQTLPTTKTQAEKKAGIFFTRERLRMLMHLELQEAQRAEKKKLMRVAIEHYGAARKLKELLG